MCILDFFLYSIVLHYKFIIVYIVFGALCQLQILESQLKIKQQQVDELQSQQGLLKDVDPDKEEEIMQKKVRVEER